MVHSPLRYDNIIYDFIWKGKTDKVNRKIIAEDYKYGGYKMVDFDTYVKAAKGKWIQRYLDNGDKDWKILFETFCKKENLPVFIQSNFRKEEILCSVPKYYSDTLECWYELKESDEEYQEQLGNQFIWYNKACLVGQTSVYNHNLFQAGIWMSKDLYENGQIIQFDKWQQRGVKIQDYMPWRNIIDAIPHTMKQEALNGINQDLVLPSVKIDNKRVLAKNVSERELKKRLVRKKLQFVEKGRF